MKITLTLIFLLFTSITYGQVYDKIATHHYGSGEITNRIDSLGRKQGFWVNYTMFFNSTCSDLSTEESDTCFQRFSSGQYINDNKIGRWNYYQDAGCFIDFDRIEIYNEDGSVMETNCKYRNCTTYYSPDSSNVTSVIIISNDTINIKCKDKKTCIATIDNKELIKFDFDRLDFEKFRFSLDIFCREILLLKNNKH